jgi:hypothetical protein
MDRLRPLPCMLPPAWRDAEGVDRPLSGRGSQRFLPDLQPRQFPFSPGPEGPVGMTDERRQGCPDVIVNTP